MENNNPSTAQESKGLSFVEQLVLEDLQAGKNGGRLNTRFPPEPNGYLHIGHAKAICMDFGIAEKFGGTCNLRFDDTNPVKEDVEYVDSIREDIHWLGFDWGDREYYPSSSTSPCASSRKAKPTSTTRPLKRSQPRKAPPPSPAPKAPTATARLKKISTSSSA